MRDELTLMELADRYLRGELTATDRAAFEERMRSNAELRELVDDQRALLGGIKRLALRLAVNKAYRSYKFGKWLPGYLSMVIIVLSLSIWHLSERRPEVDDQDQLEFTASAEQDRVQEEISDSTAQPAAPSLSTVSEPDVGSSNNRNMTKSTSDQSSAPVSEKKPDLLEQSSTTKNAPADEHSDLDVKTRLDTLNSAPLRYRSQFPLPIPPDSLKKWFGDARVPIMD